MGEYSSQLGNLQLGFLQLGNVGVVSPDYTVQLSDDLNNWLDFLNTNFIVTPDISLTLNDNLNSWNELIQTLLLSADIQFSISDDLNNWSDSIAFPFAPPTDITVALSDNFVLSDNLGIVVDLLVPLSSTLDNWIDSSTGQLPLSNTISDDLNSWSDTIVNVIFIDLTASLSDTLNSWSDTTSTYNSTSDLAYLRRYLNDVDL